jgi:hypothetical protein
VNKSHTAAIEDEFEEDMDVGHMIKKVPANLVHPEATD